MSNSLNKHRPVIAQWVPAIVVGLWGLFNFDGPWYERILYAVMWAVAMQVFLWMLYFIAAYIAARVLGQDADPKQFPLSDYKVLGAVLLSAGIWVVLQSSRSNFKRDLIRCIHVETQSRPFGQYDDARSLLAGCIEQVSASFEPDE